MLKGLILGILLGVLLIGGGVYFYFADRNLRTTHAA